ncbi:hypothetical protein M9Y10_032559 [Tritrichomonas musculus]|uniref:Uncharacterized protein n=1 Tax=Tritrichomonas musculus TaxID=1915356 RepID=A0ABR2GZK8_9EUKA
MIESDIVPFLSVLNLMKMSDILFPREGSNKAFKNFIVSYLEKKSRLNFAKIENLYPPGQMYLIRFTNDEEDGFFSKKKKKNKKDKKNKKSDKIQLCQFLNPDYFSNLVKNIQENNHFVKNYMRLIIRLMEKFKRRSTHL